MIRGPCPDSAVAVDSFWVQKRAQGLVLTQKRPLVSLPLARRLEEPFHRAANWPLPSRRRAHLDAENPARGRKIN